MGADQSLVMRRGALADMAGFAGSSGASLLLTDEHVAEAIGPRLGPVWDSLPRHVVPAGEASKSWEQLGAVLRALDAAGVDRDGQLIALGGGVVSDLGGLAAALHRRGIRWTAVPTSLIGQVDAAHGGKTAVNLGGGKNTVGCFHPAQRVVVDPTCLASLPERHLASGLAEVLKTALIAGKQLTDRALASDTASFAAANDPALSLLEACIRTKRALVAEDPRDHAARRLLNLGHTFGHAFEALALAETDAAGSEASLRLTHGEAVGLGLLCAARLARDGTPGPLESTLRQALQRWGLPTHSTADENAVLAHMSRDKKRKNGQLTAVCLHAPGQVEVREDVSESALAAALAAVRPGDRAV